MSTCAGAVTGSIPRPVVDADAERVGQECAVSVEDDLDVCHSPLARLGQLSQLSRGHAWSLSDAALATVK
ncbi:hypothetical protein GCM10020219_024560 [Nonomuraea dietziae]